MIPKSSLNCIRNANLAAFVILLSLGSLLQAQPAQSISLAWNPSSGTSVKGYRLHYGTSSGNYTSTLDAGAASSATVSNLTTGTKYYFVVTAYNAAGAESMPSNEMSTIAQGIQYGITAVNYLSNGSAQITVTGSAGLSNKVYASTDMKVWTLLTTAVNTSGTMLVADPAAATLNQRFYRVTNSKGTTAPAGFTKLPITGAASALSPSYSYLGMGLTNPVSYNGKVTSFGAQTITDSTAIWNDNQFNGRSGQFYIEIVSGSHAGLMSDIIATSAATKTLTTEDNLAPYLANGQLYKIRKHRTIGDVFGVNNSAGLNGGATVSTADEVQVFNPVTQTYLRYYYQTSGTGGIGWRSSTDSATDASGTALYLDQGVIVCRKLAGDLPLGLTGAVKTGPTIVPIGTNLNLIANVYPAGNLTLGNSGLRNSNAALGLVGAASVTDADEVHIFSGTGFQIYFFKTSGPGGTGWRNSTNPSADAGKTQIPPGASIYVLRKNGRSAFLWRVAQPF